MAQKIIPTQREIVMRDDAFIVTKTDRTGKITYANPIFIEFSGFTESELLGKQHNIVRHPDMPRTIFNMLWNTVKAGEEFFGYVKNLSKDGSFYWVHATVTPSYADNNGDGSEIIGFFSVRRKPNKDKLTIIQDFYRDILTAEKRQDRSDAISAGTEVLNKTLQSSGKSYHEFILTL
ncbi:PAS domain-containing protein [Methylomonas sp. 11b]|uniref:PAS domain-containing protein n=1 Tax=Methylomonas sp. 11b TaxID=1168169 RepID=UPI00047A91FE|nr:PAS domain-containing protein [Methylomonas sp. 11b]